LEKKGKTPQLAFETKRKKFVEKGKRSKFSNRGGHEKEKGRGPRSSKASWSQERGQPGKGRKGREGF